MVRGLALFGTEEMNLIYAAYSKLGCLMILLTNIITIYTCHLGIEHKHFKFEST